MDKARKGASTRKPPVPSDSHAEIDDWMRRLMPDLQPIVKRLDDMIRETLPDAQYAVKWKKAYYGVPDHGWVIEVVAYDVSVNVVFLGGAELRSPPPWETPTGRDYIKSRPGRAGPAGPAKGSTTQVGSQAEMRCSRRRLRGAMCRGVSDICTAERDQSSSPTSSTSPRPRRGSPWRLSEWPTWWLLRPFLRHHRLGARRAAGRHRRGAAFALYQRAADRKPRPVRSGSSPKRAVRPRTDVAVGELPGAGSLRCTRGASTSLGESWGRRARGSRLAGSPRPMSCGGGRHRAVARMDPADCAPSSMAAAGLS